MEEGVVNEILQGPLRDVFDSKQLITDVSGSGNNWWERILFYKIFIQNILLLIRWKLKELHFYLLYFLISTLRSAFNFYTMRKALKICKKSCHIYCFCSFIKSNLIPYIVLLFRNLSVPGGFFSLLNGNLRDLNIWPRGTRKTDGSVS